jgi:hypothetical protein
MDMNRSVLPRIAFFLGAFGSSLAGASSAVMLLGPRTIECPMPEQPAPAGHLRPVSDDPSTSWEAVPVADEPSSTRLAAEPGAGASASVPVTLVEALDLAGPDREPVSPRLGPHGEASDAMPLAPAREPDQSLTTSTTRSERRLSPTHDIQQPLRAEDIRDVVTRSMPGLRRCYEHSVRRAGSPLEESLTLELHVSGGTVRTATVRGAQSPGLASCLESTARRWSFPVGYAVVSVPVRLRPRLD